MRIVDSHQHFWKYSPEEFPWITDALNVLKTDFLPEDLEKVFQINGVSGCVAVQAAQTEEETNFLLRLADSHPFIQGVVGWIDLEAPNLEEKLNAYLPFRKLKGFRHILQDEADPAYILRPKFQKGLETLFKKGYSYDILVFPKQLDGAIETVRNFPEASMVIDHLAKPPIAKGELEPWRDQMEQLGSFPNVYGKLSGMVTEHDWTQWKAGDFHPYLDVMMKIFGADRLMYGSDWPVCLLAASYSEVIGVLRKFLEGYPEEVQQKIWAENAEKFYKLN
ncbi:amidohydrolase family protein [Lunatimonas salinarum]|uniref:amidohydrolase family protein n=1 Tax=Lunatimonas salinarum TaxID=1774590 RepID=UPI001FD79926|nr:amidohydrolase family protein [Lunatimonas salinarum]